MAAAEPAPGAPAPAAASAAQAQGPWGPDARAPMPVVVVSGLQHVAVASVLLSYPVLIGRAAGASEETIAALVSLTLLASGLGALLQAARAGPVGSGFLCWPSASIVYLAPSIAAAQVGGLPLVLGMTLLAGLVEMALAPLMRRARSLFPPEVAGLIGLLVGITSGAVGLKLVLGASVGDDASAGAAAPLWVAGISLAAMIALNVWGRGLLALGCVLVGGALGLAVSFGLDLTRVEHFMPAPGMPVVAFPSLAHLGWSFDASLLVPFAVGAVAAAIKTAGSVVVLQKATDPRWVRADVPNMSAGVLADGLSSTLSAAVGGVGLNASASAAGLATATGVHSRRVAVVIGAACVAIAMVPLVGAWLHRVPGPVLGAMLVFSSAFMIVNGLQIVTARMLDVRRTLVVGLGLVAGLSVELVPAVGALLSPSARAVLGTPLVLGTIVALGLNLAFRAGASRTARLRIAPGPFDGRVVADEMHAMGAAWGARRDVVERVAFAIVQAIEVLRDDGGVDSPIDVAASFDEFTLRVRMSWDGAPLEIPDRRPTEDEILDEDGARRLAGWLVRRVADSAAVGDCGGRPSLVLAFEH